MFWVNIIAHFHYPRDTWIIFPQEVENLSTLHRSRVNHCGYCWQPPPIHLLSPNFLLEDLTSVILCSLHPPFLLQMQLCLSKLPLDGIAIDVSGGPSLSVRDTLVIYVSLCWPSKHPSSPSTRSVPFLTSPDVCPPRSCKGRVSSEIAISACNLSGDTTWPASPRVYQFGPLARVKLVVVTPLLGESSHQYGVLPYPVQDPRLPGSLVATPLCPWLPLVYTGEREYFQNYLVLWGGGNRPPPA